MQGTPLLTIYLVPGAKARRGGDYAENQVIVVFAGRFWQSLSGRRGFAALLKEMA